MEDESGPINVIVKPKLYEKCRTTVRMEPFLLVRGRLQKDGLTMNVIAQPVMAVRVGEGRRVRGGQPVQGGQLETLPPALLGSEGGWGEAEQAPRAPFRYLTALRQSPPGVKSFG